MQKQLRICLKLIFIAILLALVYWFASQINSYTASQDELATQPQPFERAVNRGLLKVGVSWVQPKLELGDRVRTTVRVDQTLIDKLQANLALPVELVSINEDQIIVAIESGKVDLVLFDLNEKSVQEHPANVVPTGLEQSYSILVRGDVRIRDWRQLRGKHVCLAESAVLEQKLARQYTNNIQLFPYTSDALVALREGRCETSVVDTTLYNNLMQHEQWHLFSTESGPSTLNRILSWVALFPADVAWLKNLAEQKNTDKNADYFKNLLSQRAQNIVFDVFLDQQLPDCNIDIFANPENKVELK